VPSEAVAAKEGKTVDQRKFEVRSTKQIRITEIQMIKMKELVCMRSLFG